MNIVEIKEAHCEMLRYRCCKQHSLDRGSRIPLLLPSPGRRWLPGLAEVFHGPGKRRVTTFLSCYFGTCGMSSSKMSKDAKLHWECVARIMESSKMSCTMHMVVKKHTSNEAQKTKSVKPWWEELRAGPPWSKARRCPPPPLASTWIYHRLGPFT